MRPISRRNNSAFASAGSRQILARFASGLNVLSADEKAMGEGMVD
ncbi:hypothetical protein LJR029_005767 [Caballeronia sp. LjRoot29]